MNTINLQCEVNPILSFSQVLPSNRDKIQELEQNFKGKFFYFENEDSSHNRENIIDAFEKYGDEDSPCFVVTEEIASCLKEVFSV